MGALITIMRATIIALCLLALVATAFSYQVCFFADTNCGGSRTCQGCDDNTCCEILDVNGVKTYARFTTNDTTLLSATIATGDDTCGGTDTCTLPPLDQCTTCGTLGNIKFNGASAAAPGLAVVALALVAALF